MRIGATSALKRWLVTLVGLVVLLLGVQTQGLAQPTDEPDPPGNDEPTLSLSPSSGPSGTTVTASGEGYCGSTELRWDDEMEPRGMAKADDDRKVSIEFEVPEDSPGRYTVTSTSECGGTTASFRVTSTLTTSRPSPTPTVPPPSTTALPPSTTTAPPPPVTTALPPPDQPEEALERDNSSTLAQLEAIAKRELEFGKVLYNPPDRMRVGVVERVEVRISREEPDDLAAGLQGRGDPRVEDLLVGTAMRARLQGGAFDITPIGSEVQQLTSQGFREWRWDVIPTASGNHPLSIIVSVLHEKYPDGPIEEAPPFERRIDVSVNPGYSLSKWLSSNWEKPIFALGGIIAIIEGYRRLWLRRAEGSGGVAPGRGLRRIPERRRTRNRPKRR